MIRKSNLSAIRASQDAIRRKLLAEVPALAPAVMTALERLQANMGTAADDDFVTAAIYSTCARIREVFPRPTKSSHPERELFLTPIRTTPALLAAVEG